MKRDDFIVDGVLYNKNKRVLKEYPSRKKQDKFAIPEGVEMIAENAFSGCKYLLQVEFPRSMTVISTRAFSGCNSLQEVVIPDWITRIESKAFSYCYGLKKIVVPKGIYIDQDAFLGSDIICLISNETDYLAKTSCVDFRIRQIEKRDESEPNQLIVSEKIRSGSLFTTETEYVFSTKCEKTAFGKQKIGRDLVFASKKDIMDIDERGIIKLGTHVRSGDILVCKGTPNSRMNEEERLLCAIFGTSCHYEDTSLRVPFNVQGKVTDVKITYGKDKTGNARNNDVESASITILQKFKLSLGDILTDDESREGVVTAFDANLQECELIANFPLGKEITKKSIAEHAIQTRSIGAYALFGQYPIAKRDYFGIPQKLHFDDISKFVNSNLIDVLENVIVFQANQPQNRICLYKNILEGTPSNVFYLPDFTLNEFFCSLYGLCLKPVFRDKQGNELRFSYTNKKSELKNFGKEITLEIDELSDNEIRKMSYGEVKKAETLNARTHQAEKDGIFCESIFGPVKDYTCRCGEYSGYQYKEKICENCGVEVTTSAVRYERFGHIELAAPIMHPFLPDRKLVFLPIIPPKLRPMAKMDDGRFATSDLNDLYCRVINRNNRLKRLLALGERDIIVNNERRILQETINSLFNNNLLKHLKNFFSNQLKCVPLDYSATCNTVINDALSNEQCGLPFQIAIELFRPFLINQLCETGIAKTFKNAAQQIDNLAAGQDINQKREIIRLLDIVIRNKKLLILSKDAYGEILSLTPFLTFNNVLTLNFTQFKKLKSQMGESIKIILPASDTAQEMLRNRCVPLIKTGNIFEQEENTDFVKKLTIASTKNNTDFVSLLKESIQNHEVCTFDTVTSHYIFGKPSKWAMKFYKASAISQEQSDLRKGCENGKSE